MNIPIYRAKKIDSGEYITGYYLKDINIWKNKMCDYIKCNNFNTESLSYLMVEIDPSTIAIHFEGMIDSQGNKIFASLSEDGKGGDVFQYNNFTAYRELDNTVNTVVINQGRYALLIGDNFHSIFAIQGKVIGIQQ